MSPSSKHVSFSGNLQASVVAKVFHREYFQETPRGRYRMHSLQWLCLKFQKMHAIVRAQHLRSHVGTSLNGWVCTRPH